MAASIAAQEEQIRRSARQRQPEINLLQSEVETLAEEVYDLCQESISAATLDEVKTASNKLKATQRLYKAKVTALYQRRLDSGAIALSNEVSSDYKQTRGAYHHRLNYLSQLRGQLGDDDISVCTETTISLSELRKKPLSSAEKCEEYVEYQSFHQNQTYTVDDAEAQENLRALDENFQSIAEDTQATNTMLHEFNQSIRSRNVHFVDNTHQSQGQETGCGDEEGQVRESSAEGQPLHSNHTPHVFEQSSVEQNAELSFQASNPVINNPTGLNSQYTLFEEQIKDETNPTHHSQYQSSNSAYLSCIEGNTVIQSPFANLSIHNQNVPDAVFHNSNPFHASVPPGFANLPASTPKAAFQPGQRLSAGPHLSDHHQAAQYSTHPSQTITKGFTNPFSNPQSSNPLIQHTQHNIRSSSTTARNSTNPFSHPPANAPAPPQPVHHSNIPLVQNPTNQHSNVNPKFSARPPPPVQPNPPLNAHTQNSTHGPLPSTVGQNQLDPGAHGQQFANPSQYTPVYPQPNQFSQPGLQQQSHPTNLPQSSHTNHFSQPGFQQQNHPTNRPQSSHTNPPNQFSQSSFQQQSNPTSLPESSYINANPLNQFSQPGFQQQSNPSNLPQSSHTNQGMGHTIAPPSLKFTNFSQVTENIPDNPFLPTSSADYIVSPLLLSQRRQLSDNNKNPYRGEALKFKGFVQKFAMKINQFRLNAHEIVETLIAHCEGKAKIVVKRYEYFSFTDPMEALNKIWKDFYSSFGLPKLIKAEIKTMIQKVGCVTSSEDAEKLKEYLHICHIIAAHQRDPKNKLSVYNEEEGQAEIYNQFPTDIFHDWRDIVLLQGGVDENPNLAIFIEFLEFKVKSASVLGYKGQGATVDQKKKPTARSCQTNATPSSQPQVAALITQEGPVLNDPKQRGGTPEAVLKKRGTAKKECILHPDVNSHYLSHCRTFFKLDSDQKMDILRNNSLCFRCFRGGHWREHCTFNPKCNECDGPHQTSLHHTPYAQDWLAKNSNNVVQSPKINTLLSHSPQTFSHFPSFSKVLLVDVSASLTGSSVRCYAIIDEQSSRSFILPSLADELGVTGADIDYSLTTMHGLTTSTAGSVIDGLTIKGVNQGRSYNLPPVISNQFIPNCIDEVATPDVVKAHPGVRKYSHLFDPLDGDAEVMMLIGRDGGDIMETTCLNQEAPFVHKTSLGYALVGSTSTQKADTPDISTFKTSVEHYGILQNPPSFKDSREAGKHELDILATCADDELPDKSIDDARFDAIMEVGTKINASGHIEMPLPFRNHDQTMPNNRKAVFCRTRNTLGRLASDPAKLDMCLEVMGKYWQENHVEPVPGLEEQPDEGRAWWIPVFPVAKKGNKVRLVFDSSATYQGVSLNQVLLQGADINNTLRGVLLRFRNGVVGVSSDIECMYHSFYMTATDRNFVRFFWFTDNDPTKPLSEWRGRVQIFGNKPSPALCQHGLRVAINYPMENDCSDESKRFTSENIYVDDALSSFDCPKEAFDVVSGAKNKLQKFNIRLHKLCSNDREVVDSFPASEVAEIYAKRESEVGALGLTWNVDNDTISFKPELPNRAFTPRGVLSTNHALFDPLGLLSPVTFAGKVLQREMFEAREKSPKGVANDWDKPLDPTFLCRWVAYKVSLVDIKNVSFPRSYYTAEVLPVQKREIHVFADASFHGLGTAIFIRTVGNNQAQSSLAFASSRLAPKGAMSIPRLELNAALEASTAALKIQQELRIGLEDTYYYTDSMVVIGYLENTRKSFTRYVSRRIELIRQVTSGKSWKHVSTSQNPADLASRPQEVNVLMSSLWLHGPNFLQDPNYEVTYGNKVDPEIFLDEEVGNEVICVKSVVSKVTVFGRTLERCSKLKVVLNSVKRVMSLMHHLDEARQRLGVHLAPRPLWSEVPTESAFRVIIREAQIIFDRSKIAEFSPFQDEMGILRVGGRLEYSFLPFDGKHPVIIPKDSNLSVLIAKHYHEKVKHQGRMLTLSAIRSAGFFIPGGRGLVSSLIKNCSICIQLRGWPTVPRMANLPVQRLEESPCFTFSGMDMFGPFSITEGRTTRRNSGTKKVWGLVFICLVSRAVHIETVPGLDTTSLMNALRRFFAVRGVCRYILSDNASNFHAACKNIDAGKCLMELREEAERHDCQWRFNPPGASHMSGSIERCVKAVQTIAATSFRILGDRPMTRDEITTYFMEAVAIINNTPMYDVSNHPNEPLAICPANLLTLKDQPNPPPLETFSEDDLSSYGLKRWKRVQRIADEFWNRWRKEYLSSLQGRTKWTKDRKNVAIGDVVIIKAKNTKRNVWPTGIIEVVETSSDGVVRSCQVRTTKGTYRRAVCDLILLVGAE